MSEFSDSFHLRTSDLEDAIALLQDAKVPGYVFPTGNGFVTFVSPRGENTRRAILSANAGLLIHYSFAQDHGCSVEVYEGETTVASLSVDFEQRQAHFERTKFVAKGLVDGHAAEVISQWIRGSLDPEARSGREGHVIARTLRLPHFSWLSYDYAQSDESRHEGRLEVDGKGRTRTIERAELDDVEQLFAKLPPPRKPFTKPLKPPQPKQSPPKTTAKKTRSS